MKIFKLLSFCIFMCGRGKHWHGTSRFSTKQYFIAKQMLFSFIIAVGSSVFHSQSSLKTVENSAASEVPMWAIRITWFYMLWMDAIKSLHYNGYKIAPFLWDVLLIESENRQPGKGWSIGRDVKLFQGNSNSCHSFILHVFLECPCKETNVSIRKPPNFLKIIKSRSSLMWKNAHISLSFGNCPLILAATAILILGFSSRLNVRHHEHIREYKQKYCMAPTLSLRLYS